MLNPNVGENVDIHLKNGLMIRGIVLRSVTNYVELGRLPAIHQSSGLPEAFETIQVDPAEIVAVGIRRDKNIFKNLVRNVTH